jgi:hypothetical protein
VNLLSENKDTVKKKKGIYDNSEVGLEINTERTKHMLLSRHENAYHIRQIKIANRSFENISEFKYLGTAVTHQNVIQEEIKGRSNFGKACFYSVQNLLSSRLLPRNVKIRIS